MRLIGGAAALVICMMLGKGKAAVLNIRKNIMHSFAMDMRYLAGEMEYRPRDIKDMIHKLSEGALGGFWRELAVNISLSAGAEQAWEYTAKTHGEFEVLSPQEIAIIAEAGGAIGIMSAEDSAKMLKYSGEQAESKAEELQEQLKSKGVVYQKLGLFWGLAAMLLIV